MSDVVKQDDKTACVFASCNNSKPFKKIFFLHDTLLTINRRFPEITGEIIWKSEAPVVGHHFIHGLDLYTGIYRSMISAWRQQLKNAGL